MAIYLVSITDDHINNKSKKWPPPFLCVRVNHIRRYIHGHIILIWNVSLVNIHFLFFTMTVRFDLYNWLLTGKYGNRIHDFMIFPPYCSDVRQHISNHIWWSLLLFVHFNHIPQWNIFHLVCSHCSCCSNSHCAQVPQQSWACKITVHNNVIIGASASQEICWVILQLLMHQELVLCFHIAAELDPYFTIEYLTYGRTWIQYPNGVAITHNLNPNFIGLPGMYCFAPCFPK